MKDEQVGKHFPVNKITKFPHAVQLSLPRLLSSIKKKLQKVVLFYGISSLNSRNEIGVR